MRACRSRRLATPEQGFLAESGKKFATKETILPYHGLTR
jgi:hypothetical protein